MKIFLDDDKENRPTPAGWERVYDVHHLFHVVMNNQNEVEEISLDNDLGDLPVLIINEREFIQEGFQFVNWLEEDFHEHGETFLPNLKKVNIHSANSVRRDDMLRGMAAINRRFNSRQIEVTVIDFQHL